MAISFFQKLQDLFQPQKVDLVERFQLVREAVNGTMSSFHQAIDRKNGKTVGLKILDAEKTEVFEGRFRSLKKPSEGKIAMLMKHPRIVETYEFGTAKDGRQYIVMEFVPGTGLNILINNHSPILEGRRHLLIRQMAEAIEAVHKAGFIHRDICPRNFIVTADGTTLKLIDFGLTLPMKKEYMLPGNRTGTPLYMAPEIVRRRNTDQRVDIFSFGVTAYQLCSFDFPWPASDTTGRGALQHDSKPPTPILEKCPNLNKDLAKVIMQCITADAAGRPSSAEQIVKSLKMISRDEA
ncbi:serine/threonine protein kinase [Pirellula staleyi DSM 6068]|uniref:Serine/threonine protein kinase n=1 Tax=Pirellula staleyi (strain ATCC 27377 / DSM 6068 / ICPB 4128) TaxID=530564 RepID=D2QWY8_PIRSD|nr:serine/threonine-protein kinase [Pirellula staleyi]ADB16092.1 serine/threonine protein kinase [Pirellula staleyi DSM 6068]